MRQSRLAQTKPAASSTTPKPPTPTTPPKPVSNTNVNTNNNGLGWTGQGTTGQKQKASNNNSSPASNGWSKGKKWTVGILGTTALATGYGLKKIDDAANGYD